MKNRNKVLYLAGMVLLVIFSQVSCIYDYYLDESNLKIRIPQLSDGSIDNALVVVHNTSDGTFAAGIFIDGSSVTNRWNTVSYNASNNLIRFKVTTGETYQISAFANVDEGCFTTETLDLDQFAIWEASYDGTDYSSSFDDLRFLFTEVEVETTVMNDSDAIEMDLGSELSNLYHAKITCEFNMPSELEDVVDYILIRFKTSSHFYTSGKYGMQSATQWVTHKFDYTSGAEHTISVFPSPGYHYQDTGYQSDGVTPMDSSDGITDFDMEVYFYSSGDELLSHTESVINSIGTAYGEFTAGRYNGLKWGKPELGSGYTLINLAPKEELTITFSGWTVVGITLEDWSSYTSTCECLSGGTDCGCHGLDAGSCTTCGGGMAIF